MHTREKTRRAKTFITKLKLSMHLVKHFFAGSQQFSPVADWMSNVDLFLEDEGQQYGNMEEAASVARTPAKYLEVWSGDHRQTPGGLKKSKKSKSFRKKRSSA